MYSETLTEKYRKRFSKGIYIPLISSASTLSSSETSLILPNLGYLYWIVICQPCLNMK